MNNKTKIITLNGIVAALYAILTLINPLSFGAIQFRVSTILLPLSCFIPQIRIGLVVGTIIGNLTSALGIIDIVFGCAVTAITVFIISKTKIYFRPLLYAINSGILVAIELYVCFKTPIIYSILTVGVSGLILYAIGLPLCMQMSKLLIKHLI